MEEAIGIDDVVVHDASRDAAQTPPDFSRTLSGSRNVFALNDPVLVKGSFGYIRYIGPTKFAAGLWIGVELLEAEGKNNGTVQGVTYFECAQNHGVFAPAKIVVPYSLGTGASKQGYVLKKSGMFSRWGKRWAVLIGSKLQLYESPSDKPGKQREYDLLGARIERQAPDSDLFTITLSTTAAAAAGTTGSGSVGGAGTGSSQSTQLRGVSVAEATEWVATLQAASTDTTSADALTPGRVVVDAHLGDSSPIIILGSPVTPTDVLPVGGSLHTPPAPLTPSTAQQLQHQRQPSGEADAWNRAAAAGAPDSGAGVGVTSGSGDVPTLQDSSVLQLPPTPVTSAATPQEEAVLPAVTPAPAVGSQSPLPRAVSPQPASRSSSALPDGSASARLSGPLAVSRSVVPRASTLQVYPVVSQVSCGENHTVVLTITNSTTEAGAVFTWGGNRHGQLGIGNKDPSHVPVQVRALGAQNITCVSAGWYHTCAVTAAGDLYVWGCGLDGRLGLGSEHDQLSPQYVFALKGQTVTSVAAGGFHTLALTAAHHVFSWGYGGNGRLGHGDRANRTLPEWIESLRHTHTVQIAAGGSHSLALTAAGDVLAWGEGAMGQLGLGTNDSVALPQYLPALRGCGVAMVAAGWRHSLALAGGEGSARPVLYAWGDNTSGQLGIGARAQTNIPTPVVLSAAQEQQSAGAEAFRPAVVACGFSHSLCIGSEGAVFAWGDGTLGALGHGNRGNVSTPAIVRTLLESSLNVTQLAGGFGHSVAICGDGTVYTWGFGRIGHPDVEFQPVPRRLASLTL